MKRRILAFGISIVAAVSLLGCATLPPQTRPTSPEPFVGRWTGTWSSYRGPYSGSVDLEVTSLTPDKASFSVKLTNAVVPGFGLALDFRNGELVHSSQSLDMTFRLHGATRLEAEYNNKRIGDTGRWSLTRTVAK